MNKSYYAIIPAGVRYNKELPMGARMLYGELTALANENGYCWATNGYFAELYDVTPVTISNWITKLEEQGHIQRKIIYREGNKEIKERRIYIAPIKENFKENNTVSNNTFNNTDDIVSPSSKEKKNSPKGDIPYKEIVQAYNDICKSLPDVRIISDKRKDKMRVSYRGMGDINKFIEAFKKAENSDFLSGRNGRWSGCNFDWLINYNNFIKVIEGTYDNRGGGSNGEHRENNGEGLGEYEDIGISI